MKFKEIDEFQINMHICVFAVSAFIGWLYETILTSVCWGRFADRGFLQLPLCPIYGVGAVALLMMFGRVRNSIVLFSVSAITTTLIELVASYFLEYLFHVELWTYRHWSLNFQGRISFWSSVLFGVMAVFLIKFIYPSVQYFMKNLDKRSRVFLSILTLGSMLLDTVLCLRGVVVKGPL